MSDTVLSTMPTVASTTASTAGHLSAAVVTAVARAISSPVDSPMSCCYSSHGKIQPQINSLFLFHTHENIGLVSFDMLIRSFHVEIFQRVRSYKFTIFPCALFCAFYMN